MEAVDIELDWGGQGLLDGICEAQLYLRDGSSLRATLDQPPGSPSRPPTPSEMERKIAGCCAETAVSDLDWTTAAGILDISLESPTQT
jgi:hypothetical protein